MKGARSAGASPAGDRSAAAPRSAGATRSWTRLAGLTVAVTVVGVVAGAAIAAPSELLLLGRWAGAQVVGTAVPLASDAWSAASQAASAAGSATIGFQQAPHTPREIGMLAAGGLALLFAVAAAVRGWQAGSRRRAARTPFGGVGMPRGGLSLAGVAPARRPSKRTAPRTTPKEVRALVERGSTLTQIARRTGLPVDALAMLLDASEPTRQIQP